MRSGTTAAQLYLIACLHLIRCVVLATPAEPVVPAGMAAAKKAGEGFLARTRAATDAVQGFIKTVVEEADEPAQKKEAQLLIIRPPGRRPATAAQEFWGFSRFYVFLIVAVAVAISLWQNPFSQLCKGIEHLFGLDRVPALGSSSWPPPIWTLPVLTNGQRSTEESRSMHHEGDSGHSPPGLGWALRLLKGLGGWVPPPSQRVDMEHG